MATSDRFDKFTDRARKVLTYKYKKRKHSEKTRGHRQYISRIKILDVVLA